MARRPSKRSLSKDEKHLWEKVTQSIRPLDALPVLPALPIAPKAPAKRNLGTSQLSQRPAPANHGAPKKDNTQPVLAAGDPREARKVGRGRTEIDATIDLHGMRQLEAEIRLRDFLKTCRTRGARVALVITGKGNPEERPEPFSDEPRGVLRRRFLEWVEASPLRELISSVRPAHPRHGGRGAFYVFLKRAKR